MEPAMQYLKPLKRNQELIVLDRLLAVFFNLDLSFFHVSAILSVLST